MLLQIQHVCAGAPYSVKSQEELRLEDYNKPSRGKDADTAKDAKTDQGWTALTLASMYGHESIVRALLDAGADKEVKNENGKTALALATMNGHKAVVALLSGSG